MKKSAIRVLMIDDDVNFCARWRKRLEQHCEVHVAYSADAGIQASLELLPDVVLLDLYLSPERRNGGAAEQPNGFATLERIHADRRDLPVIMLTRDRSHARSLEAGRQGAFDYLCKPPDLEDLLKTIRYAHEQARLREQQAYLQNDLDQRLGEMVAGAECMQELLCMARKCAQVNRPVLIQGETGTGKEMLARYVRDQSPRREERFAGQNCAELSGDLLNAELFGHVAHAYTGAKGARKGLFRYADRGTLFLDEIAEASFDLQARLLRVLQEGVIRPVGADDVVNVDVRLIFAANRDLRQACDEGRFRSDLYHRIAWVTLEIPPLRQRAEDIPTLARQFLRSFAIKENKDVRDLSPEALNHLRNQRWPGNIRELKNVIERATLFCEGKWITLGDVTGRFFQRDGKAEIESLGVAGCMEKKLPDASREVRTAFERHYVMNRLKQSGGNVARAAALSGMAPPAFRKVMNRCGVDPHEFATSKLLV